MTGIEEDARIFFDAGLILANSRKFQTGVMTCHFVNAGTPCARKNKTFGDLADRSQSARIHG